MGDFDSACFHGCVHHWKKKDIELCNDCNFDNDFKNYKKKEEYNTGISYNKKKNILELG